VIDQRGRLLVAALGFAGLSGPSYDRSLWALRLDSWSRWRRRAMSRTKESQNKALVLEAFDTLFNKRDYVAAERYWSPHYIQHSAHSEPGRDGLFNLIKSIAATLKYEHGVIVADGDFVIIHGRFSGHGRPKSWIAADILGIVDGVLVEHWDVLQDEATQAESKIGLPMFGSSSFTE
jgi:predicted SnoaL-like aldol condensation-catalyzing enzyme